jgi:hypothetical protein
MLFPYFSWVRSLRAPSVRRSVSALIPPAAKAATARSSSASSRAALESNVTYAPLVRRASLRNAISASGSAPS